MQFILTGLVPSETSFFVLTFFVVVLLLQVLYFAVVVTVYFPAFRLALSLFLTIVFLPCLTVIFFDVTFTLPDDLTTGLTVAFLDFLLAFTVLILLIVTLSGVGFAA
ncbi:hypothetical protein C1H84_14180 [Glutamicibacter soli]|uniref:Uncharacterized protein n=1 Tax=Glutamicibacter soli TaxID=453836 RepID=A0A365YC12_9MICC|nr:hypothetical protein C1H84_14180 [Glutamicibacter soli]